MSKRAQLKYTVIGIYLLLTSCGKINEDKRVLIFESEEASWITDGSELPASDSLFYLDNPTPLFRKEFSITKPVAQAKLFITAAGYYLAWLNGERIGDQILAPAWTDYSKRIYYSGYDITESLLNQKNCIGIALGNGFYNPLPLRKWGRRNLRNDTKVGKPAILAMLSIAYKDGTSETMVSDTSWRHAFGPIRHNSVYLGVKYDARHEIDGWNEVGFDDQSWKPAVKGDAPGGELQEAFFPPVQIAQEIKPVDVYSPQEGTWIVDMGVNFTGTYKIRLEGNEGDTIHFRFGERVYEDGSLNPMTSVIGQIKRPGIGGPGAPDVAWQRDLYVMGEEGSGIFQPDFTYHVYRYMEIKGLDYKPEPEDITGLFTYTNVDSQNTFDSSSDLLNDIQEVTRRTFLANLVSVQSDCPAREKFGYGGDLNATSESYIYNFDVQSIYRKTIYDWVDAMNDSTFVDTAPFVGVKYCGISWESAFLITQYHLYLYYNDIALVEELYELDKQWMEKVARIHPEGLVTSGLSDHESLEPVPVELTGTSHYLQCARIMQEFASVMGDEESVEKYKLLAEKLKSIVKERFWDVPVNQKINRQTLFANLLYHGIIPAGEIEAAKDSLLKAVSNGPAGHFNTGIFGTKYVLEALSKYESPEAVFDIVNSTTFPGWGFMIDNGATTLWETWKESDNTYSNCHPMFGSVTEWYYRWLGGIRPDEEYPGFERFTLAPSTPQGLDGVNCTYQSPYGSITSNWKRNQKGGYEFELIIPEGTTARVKLPLSNSQELQVKSGPAIDPEMLKGGEFALQGGEYVLTTESGS